jgi:ABC-type branched-subunit amino acid transport system permease subunit
VLPSVLAGGVVAGVFALAVSVPMFRFRALYFAVASLVLAQALAVFMADNNALGGDQGIFLSGAALLPRYILAGTSAGRIWAMGGRSSRSVRCSSRRRPSLVATACR